MIGDVSFLHGGHTPRCIASVDKHFTYHTLQLMTRGGVEIFYDERRVEMHGAWLWPCHPGPLIRFQEFPRGNPWEHRYIAFSGPRVAAWRAEGLWPDRPEPVAAADARRWATLLDEALVCAHRSDRLSWLTVVNLIERLLLERAHGRARVHPQPPPWLTRVAAELARAAGRNNYAQLARVEGMSLTTLRRRFAAATGQSLHQFHLTARIAEARRLLGDSDAPIKDISARLGYRDVFYFSRQFTRVVGAPPAAYRRSRQA